MFLAACSIVPDWSEEQAREQAVTVVYESRIAGTTVPLPVSSAQLKVHELVLDPPGLQQTFGTGTRLLHLPTGRAVTVRCRYQLFRTSTPDGRPRPWITPQELFPGAAHIEVNR